MDETYVSKYNTALSFFNKILENMNGDKHVPIDDLAQFKDIDRYQIINKNILTDEAINDILKVYSKNDIHYHDRKRIKNYILTICRILCASIDHKFNYKQEDSYFVIDGQPCRKTTYIYSIVKNIK